MICRPCTQDAGSPLPLVVTLSRIGWLYQGTIHKDLLPGQGISVSCPGVGCAGPHPELRMPGGPLFGQLAVVASVVVQALFLRHLRVEGLPLPVLLSLRSRGFSHSADPF